MRKLILLIALLVAVPAFAQERPIAGTTVQTTDTTANSVLVGCAVGSTTCTGGVKAGPIVGSTLTGSTTDAGVGSQTVLATLARTGGSSATSTERMGGFVFSDANNATLTGGMAGVRENPSGNFLGGITLFVHTTSGSAATDFSGLTEVARINSTGLLSLRANLATVGLEGNGTNGIGIGATNGSGAIRFYTGGTTLRWGINAAGDHTFGASSHISDSSGTPVIASGFGSGANTIAGADYAFIVNSGGAAGVTGTVTFGHTWTTAPVCVASNSAASSAIVVGTTTTTVTLTVGTGTLASPVYVLCRSY
jgi:hypothetical protein